jgi:hypothetical protein
MLLTKSQLTKYLKKIINEAITLSTSKPPMIFVKDANLFRSYLEQLLATETGATGFGQKFEEIVSAIGKEKFSGFPIQSPIDLNTSDDGNMEFADIAEFTGGKNNIVLYSCKASSIPGVETISVKGNTFFKGIKTFRNNNSYGKTNDNTTFQPGLVTAVVDPNMSTKLKTTFQEISIPLIITVYSPGDKSPKIKYNNSSDHYLEGTTKVNIAGYFPNATTFQGFIDNYLTKLATTPKIATDESVTKYYSIKQFMVLLIPEETSVKKMKKSGVYNVYKYLIDNLLGTLSAKSTAGYSSSMDYKDRGGKDFGAIFSQFGNKRISGRSYYFVPKLKGMTKSQKQKKLTQWATSFKNAADKYIKGINPTMVPVSKSMPTAAAVQMLGLRLYAIGIVMADLEKVSKGKTKQMQKLLQSALSRFLSMMGKNLSEDMLYEYLNQKTEIEDTVTSFVNEFTYLFFDKLYTQTDPSQILNLLNITNDFLNNLFADMQNFEQEEKEFPPLNIDSTFEDLMNDEMSPVMPEVEIEKDIKESYLYQKILLEILKYSKN